MAVPHQTLDGVRLAVGDLGVNRRLVTASGVELVGFARRAVFVAGAHGRVGRCGALFLGHVRREMLTTMRVTRGLKNHFLIHLLKIVAAHAEITHRSIPSHA